jgi:K+ transporter
MKGLKKRPAEKPNSQGAQPKQKSRLAQLSLAALGVVFGDISTSPIYAIRECFHGEYGIDVSGLPIWFCPYLHWQIQDLL